MSNEKLRILIIDDNLEIHQDFKTVLSFKKEYDPLLDEMDEKLFGNVQHENVPAYPQFEIDSAMQGEEGCELVREALRQNKPYALAFVDIRMPPGIDGVETIKRILTDDKKIQLVICTAYSDYSWEKIIEKLEQQDNISILKKPFDHVHVRKLAVALTKKWQLLRSTTDDIRASEKKIDNEIEQLAFQKHQDLLTRLPSKTFFYYFIEEAIRYAEHNMYLFSILRIDIDKLAMVADRYGQAAKNELLNQIFDRISKQLRNHDLLAKLGDDQFGVVLTNFNFSENVKNAVERILAALQEPFVVQIHQVFISASIGVSFFPIDAKFPEELVSQAELGMRNAKALGDNQYQFYLPELVLDNTASSQFEIEIRDAIQRNEFFLLYQPQYDLTKNKIRSVEAFLRWNHPVRGVLTPIDFISSLENTGVFATLGSWVVKAVCQQCVAWKKSGLSALLIAINITPHQFHRPDFVKTVDDILQETQVNPQCIEFEITDTILETYADAKNKIAQLKALGISLVLDNFGTNYLSVNSLRDNYYHKLKIDQSFTRHIYKNAIDEIIIQAIIVMASGMHVDVVASGIENQEQLLFLKENGCKLGQGFYLSEPLTVPALEKRLLDT